MVKNSKCLAAKVQPHWLCSGLRASIFVVFLLVAGLGVSQGREAVMLTVEGLTGRSFQFSWREGEAGGVNGILVLDKDNRIFGVNSPNETSWEIDGQGRLLIRHADGRA
jgi:hypothetical protein